MNDVIIKDKDIIIMKLLHFFITEEGYTPIIVHGVQDEIWLENMKGPYSIIRIMSGHIHNSEQLEFDLYKAHSLITRIKRKTLSFRVKALSIFLDVEDNVELADNNEIDCVNVNNEEDIKNYEAIKEAFPNIASKLEYTEDGLNLFAKITEDINKVTESEAKRNEEVFTKKRPYITIILIALNVLAFIYSSMAGLETVGTYGGLYAPYVRGGEFYRLITCAFLHANVFHLFLNMYALYIIGTQIESFFGSFKYLIIYLFSALSGSLLSMAFLGDAWSIGASGAIFGLFGAMLYFGYNYRVYLGSTVKTQIVPLIIINLLISFTIPGIDPFAHLGGLIGGIIISMAVGLKYKTSTMERINGIIISALAMIFLIYVAFIYSANL